MYFWIILEYLFQIISEMQTFQPNFNLYFLEPLNEFFGSSLIHWLILNLSFLF